MSTQDCAEDIETLQQIIAALSKHDQIVKQRILQTVATFFQIDQPLIPTSQSVSVPQDIGHTKIPQYGSFSEDRTISPKAFLMEKQPVTDVERVACLAYYLTHYRNTPHFKTLDISKLNTEAAQVKFSNSAWAVDNATKRGYIAQATQGNRQLSALGERFVLALPNREEAKAAMTTFRSRRKSRRTTPPRPQG